jgi:hypothetical protein
VSGGDIRNAVLKAALAAASEPGDVAAKRIRHRHFEDGIRDVVAARQVMDQTIRQPEADASIPADDAQMLIRRLASQREDRFRGWLAPAISVAALVVALASLAVALLR